MDERMKILIAEVSKRICFTGTFKEKPGVIIVASDLLKMNKI